MKPYFYVYRYGDKAPTVRHGTLANAQAEAERLAAKHPGVQFEILQCLGFASTSKASTFWADGCAPEPEREHYYLQEGDEIMKGDEVNHRGWRPSLAIGSIMKKEHVGTYRRKIK